MLRVVSVGVAAGVLWLCAACGSQMTPVATVATPTTSSAATATALPGYDKSRDANADIMSALSQATGDRREVLIDFGAGWCPECRILHRMFESDSISPLLDKDYHLVLVDIGNFDYNLDIVHRYIDLTNTGIPALVVLDVNGGVRVAATVYSFTDDQSDESNEAALRAFLTHWA